MTKETVEVRFIIDRESINRRLGNVSTVPVERALHELLTDLLGVQTYREGYSEWQEEGTEIEGSFEILRR